MRITVRRVLEILATYPDRRELFKEHPDLEEEDLQQALAFAGAKVDGTVDLHLDAALSGLFWIKDCQLARRRFYERLAGTPPK